MYEAAFIAVVIACAAIAIAALLDPRGRNLSGRLRNANTVVLTVSILLLVAVVGVSDDWNRSKPGVGHPPACGQDCHWSPR